LSPIWTSKNRASRKPRYQGDLTDDEWGLVEAADSAQTGGDSAGFRGLIV
jgi:hypothetical protein